MDKERYAQPSSSLKILWTWLSIKFSFDFYVFIDNFNCYKNIHTLAGIYLMCLKEHPRPNLKVFQYCLQRQSFTKCLRQNLVFMWNSAQREKFNFCFSGEFYWQNFHFLRRTHNKYLNIQISKTLLDFRVKLIFGMKWNCLYGVTEKFLDLKIMKFSFGQIKATKPKN